MNTKEFVGRVSERWMKVEREVAGVGGCQVRWEGGRIGARRGLPANYY